MRVTERIPQSSGYTSGEPLPALPRRHTPSLERLCPFLETTFRARVVSLEKLKAATDPQSGGLAHIARRNAVW
jgi:hypothetical protein